MPKQQSGRTGTVVRLAASVIPALLLAGCDPGVHIGYEKDFDGRVDNRCIERALRGVSPDVLRGSYISEGARGFPRGTEVTQFSYQDPIGRSDYSLDIALLPGGKTHYVHEWGKLGTDIPQEQQEQVLPGLERANEAIASLCGLSFAGTKPEIGPG